MGQSSEELARILSGATVNQLRWVAARLRARSDAEAARAIGVTPRTVSRWRNKADLDRAVALLSTADIASAVEAASAVLARGALGAAQALSEKARQGDVRAIEALLDRIGMGRTSTVVSEGDTVLRIVWEGDGADTNLNSTA